MSQAKNSTAPTDAQPVKPRVLTQHIAIRSTFGEDNEEGSLFQVCEGVSAYAALSAASNLLDITIAIAEEGDPSAGMSSSMVGAVRSLLSQAKGAIDAVRENTDHSSLIELRSGLGSQEADHERS